MEFTILTPCLNEALTAPQWIGICLITIGVICVSHAPI